MAHPDLDELLNALYDRAVYLLNKNGEFFPIGATIDEAGELNNCAGYTGKEQPPSQEIIDLLEAAFRQQVDRGELRAAGICLDARVTRPGQSEPQDAICARLEHRTGENVEVYLPYRKLADGTLEYGELFASRLDGVIFSTKSQDER